MRLIYKPNTKQDEFVINLDSLAKWLNIEKLSQFLFPKHSIEKIKYFNLQSVVEYQGKKYGTEKELAFSDSDVFVFPTFYSSETFGLVNLEAMQHSLPIISTKEGGIPDIILEGVNGFLVPKKNSKALADKLEVLIGNPELRNKMGLAGKMMYEEKFTLEIFEKRIIEILHDCLKEKIA